MSEKMITCYTYGMNKSVSVHSLENNAVRWLVGHVLIEFFIIFSYSSPDSDDTYYGDDSEEGRDDQYLVSDRCESKFYGSVHGGSTAGSTAAPGGFSAASANITRSIKVWQYTFGRISENNDSKCVERFLVFIPLIVYLHACYIARSGAGRIPTAWRMY